MTSNPTHKAALLQPNTVQSPAYQLMLPLGTSCSSASSAAMGRCAHGVAPALKWPFRFVMFS